MTLSANSVSTSRSSGCRTFYTDGGCHNTDTVGKKGLGAWAFVEFAEEKPEILTVYGGHEGDSTNNRTEMLAVINAMKFCPAGTTVDIISDSGYVVKGYNHPAYLDSWVRNNWRTASNKPVMNQDLWQEILGWTYSRGVKFKLCRGHFKDPDPVNRYWNSIVDKACTYIMQHPEYHAPYVVMQFDTAIDKIISAEVVSWG